STASRRARSRVGALRRVSGTLRARLPDSAPVTLPVELVEQLEPAFGPGDLGVGARDLALGGESLEGGHAIPVGRIRHGEAALDRGARAIPDLVDLPLRDALHFAERLPVLDESSARRLSIAPLEVGGEQVGLIAFGRV